MNASQEIARKPASGFDDNLDGFVEGFIGADAPLLPASDTPLKELSLPEVHKESCAACRGSGIFYGRNGRAFGKCFKCGGNGFRMFRTSASERTAAKQSRENRKARDAAAASETFKTEHPEEHAWLVQAAGQGFEFAQSCLAGIAKYGSLTVRQMSGVASAVEKAKARQAERVAREANAQTVSVAPIEEAFGRARASGLKWPKVTIAAFTFKPASATSKNAGSLYVTTGGAYLGRVSGGKFITNRECTAEQEARIIAVCADPKAAAIEHGKLTGCCAICARELTNDESIARGIGPICASKFGW